MILIGETSFHIDAANLSRSALRKYATELFEYFDDNADSVLHVEDYEIHLDIEEGSIWGTGRILAGLGVVYFSIGSYGSFVQGVREISAQTKYLGDLLIAEAPKKLGLAPETVRKKRRSSARLGQLERLFKAVAEGHLTPEDATERALEILEKDERVSEDIRADLSQSMKSIRLHPEQLSLIPAEELTGTDGEPFAVGEPQKKSSGIRDQQPAIPTNRLRVEVWRRRKGTKKLVRIVEL